jgi:hypothetical protein
MKSKDADEIDRKRDAENLDGRYGKIGIPAVAAAVAYKGEIRNTSDVPVAPSTERWLAQRAAA